MSQQRDREAAEEQTRIAAQTGDTFLSRGGARLNGATLDFGGTPCVSAHSGHWRPRLYRVGVSKAFRARLANFYQWCSITAASTFTRRLCTLWTLEITSV